EQRSGSVRRRFGLARDGSSSPRKGARLLGAARNIDRFTTPASKTPPHMYRTRPLRRPALPRRGSAEAKSVAAFVRRSHTQPIGCTSRFSVLFAALSPKTLLALDLA